MARPKQRTGELRERLVHVALDTLAADGVAALTTRRVAEGARTSTPAVYELFGDKAGLVRAVCFEGFRLLQDRFDELEPTGDPRRDIRRVFEAFRRFAVENPRLSELMFSRRFADFDPGPADMAAGGGIRKLLVGRVRRALEAGALEGDATDIALVLVAVAQGLAAAEAGGRLGRSAPVAARRWALAIDAVLDGLRPGARRTA